MVKQLTDNMTQYIDKSAIVAEIEKLQDSTMDENGNFCTAQAQAEYDILCVLEDSINNIEVEHDTFIEKGCEWLKDFCDEHYIMSYIDSHEVETKELVEIFKKKMEE